MRNKRGELEFGIGVSIFVFIMALLMIIYLLLVPAEERNRILGDGGVVGVDCEKNCREDFDQCKNRCGSYGVNTVCIRECDDDFQNCMSDCRKDGGKIGVPDGGSLLLSESPGLVKPLQKFKLSVDLNPISLFSQVRRTNIPLSKSLYVSSWIVGSDEKKITFDLANAKNTAKMSLVFFPGDKNGILEIKLNGNSVYSGNANVNDLPIELPVSLLKDRNQLSFSSRGGGLAKSYYNLGDISLIVESFEQNLRSNRKFVLAKDEVNGLNRAFLSYFISCGSVNNRQGNLRVDFNGKTLYDDVVFCDAGRPSLDINKDLIREGDNTLDFVLKPVGDNSYSVSDIKFNGDMKNFDFPKYRFDLGRRQFEDVRNGRADVVLNLFFKDIGFRKEATININGAELYFNTNSAFVNLDLSDFIVAGSNFIKIVPREAFEIERLDVVIG